MRTYRSIYFKRNAIVHTQMLILQVSALIFGHHQAILVTHREHMKKIYHL